MLKRDWKKSLRTPHIYKVGNNTFRIQKQLIVFIVIFAGLTFIYICPSMYHAICFHPVDSSVPLCRFYKYNKTYPITRPVETTNGVNYKIAIISDLDERSKNLQKKDVWYSILKTGHLLWVPLTNTLSVTWDNQDVILSSSLAMGGRGMEFSELVTFDGHLLTFDDRTGIVYSIEESQIYPWVILMDGNGKSSKGFKSEWATVKDEQLYVGSMGKEWTTSSGQFQHNNPQWIKIISPRGETHTMNWIYNYKKLRKAINIEFPGYMIHESGIWSSEHESWFFLPRRCSIQRYNETLDETMSCNVLLKADENFKDIQVTNIGTLTPTRGFSSFKFLPGSNEKIIIALKSEEYQGRMSTYIVAFTTDGDILMPEMKVANEKFEGFEFI
ncbi:soluble calcium-activated nucleotidase 1 [Belonocnema kinseyi]|uniref:soluble calcium-activated nucleotidase 1 n=1 Tax=Belonocnema kinseyi TaxID=2817044 RepID=UPI00143CDF1B|nr:soluble calcium-activated nucleotidase 1 [Belonocnema kinseyi]